VANDSSDSKAGTGCTQLTRKWLSTGDMARLSGTTLRTVRFYETEGLISPSGREGTSHRRFSPTELRKLQCISGMREAGLSLQDIKTLIAIKSRCASAESAASALMAALGAKLAEMQQRIQVLERVRADLCATVDTLRTCHECAAPSFPTQCGECSHMDHPELPAGTHLLWKN
jgi:DNA-binding transcriptional MerR regulator